MRWSNEAPPRYSLHFEDRAGPAAPRPDGCGRKLVADTLEDAKLEAAILYACADLPAPPSYRIVKGARSVVYRYPERLPPAQGFQTLSA